MNAIKAIRKRLCLTQADLGAGIGCSQANVGHYETKGQTVPPEVAKRLIAFARGLGHAVSYEDIYGPVPDAIAAADEPAVEQVVVNA